MLFLDYSPKLNTTEIDIFHYISKNSSKVCFMTIRELSEEMHIGQTSIWRFCKKFECEGYSDFRFKLRQYVKEKKKRAISEAIDETALISFLHQTTEEFIGNRIQEASKELIDKEIIIFLGWGASKIIADYGAYYFSSIFNFSLSVANPLANPISNISGETAKKVGIIAMSMSGESPKVIRNLEYFTDLGTTIVSITNSDKNSISNIFDVNIPIYVSIEMNLTADITSHVPAIFLIEKLAKNIAILQKSS